MTTKEHPCKNGLTEECFKKYPKWARRMFAYRLLITLFPGSITKRLPQLKGIFPLLVPPDWPTHEIWPPAVYVDPSIIFPSDWTPEDPLPDGVTIDPGTFFPSDWTPGDELPEGVMIDPGTFFPSDWTPGDELPEGVMIAPAQRPSEFGTNPIPPLYLALWGAGPVHTPIIIEPEVAEPFFHETWGPPQVYDWVSYDEPGASSEIISGRLRQTAPADSSKAQYYYEFTENWPANYDLSFKVEAAPGAALLVLWLVTGTHKHYFNFYTDQDWVFYNGSGDHYGSYVGTEVEWKVSVTGNSGVFYRDGIVLDSNCLIIEETTPPPYIYMQNCPWSAPDPDSVFYIDDIKIVET